jgi:lipoyl(octanoyl) transferase
MTIIRQLGLQNYLPVFQAMKQFTAIRDETTQDEIWFLEHLPVYTQGQAGKAEHVLNPGDIPIVQSDRGGQVTYHGPGQLVVYTLLDLKRRQMGVRTLVNQLEQIIIRLLKSFNIDATIQCGAPGVYVGGQKIASIGLRVKNNRTYHGIALNVAMDLTPFLGINPCGYKQLEMTSMVAINPSISLEEVRQQLMRKFISTLATQALPTPQCPIISQAPLIPHSVVPSPCDQRKGKIE